MKKTLVALAVAAFATSASAVTVYDNEGTKVDVKGSARVLLTKNKSERADLANNGSRVEFNFSHALNEDTKVLGYTRVDLGDNVTTKFLYAGFDSKAAGRVTFGNQPVSTDGLDTSDYTTLYGGVSEVTTSGKKAVNYQSPSFDGFSFGAHYLFGEKDRTKRVKATDEKAAYSNGFGGALKYSGDLGEGLKLDVNGGFTQENYKTEMYKNVKRNAYIGSVGVSNDDVAFGVTYTASETTKGINRNVHEFANDNGSVKVPFNKLTGLGVGGKVNVTKENAIYAHYAFQTAKTSKKTPAADSHKAKGHSFTVGTSYKFHKQAVTFVDYGTSKWKLDGNLATKRDHKVGVGLRVFF